MPDYPSQMPSGDGNPSPEYQYSSPSTGGGKKAKPWLFAATVAGLFGAIFSGISTSDFIAHLDRQVHSIHCSFIPGAAAQIGESGCRTVMMSPYSSLFRDSMWGGLPISLLAFAVFCYLLARGLSFGMAKDITRKETSYLILAWALPVLMSFIYGYISAAEIGSMCKLCIGTYVSSGLGMAFAVIAHMQAPPTTKPKMPEWAVWFGIGVVYVVVLVVLYMGFAPQEADPAKGCGTLAKRDDPSGIILDLGGAKGGADAVAVLDPLCPACKGFDKRMVASGLYDKLKVSAVLFPLDSTCNWMVKDSLHPGACAVSEAMLCDKGNAARILDWAFEHQEELKNEAKADERKMRRRIAEKFPSVKGCLGSAKIKNKVNKSLRWGVANALPVLTPQLFVEGTRVCDEDTDLGLEFTVASMLKGGRK
jgi:uncharacterized membrane protein